MKEKWNYGIFESSTSVDHSMELALTFDASLERENFSEEEKEAVFRSIQPFTDLQSLIDG